MKSSVYISTEKIEVVGYEGKKVKRFVEYPLAEGTMINGMITDAAFLTECLTAMRQENPQLFNAPSLIVDGSAILSRRLVTPRLSKKRYQQLVRDDFADTTDNPDNLVCGYHKFGTEGNSDIIFACAVDRTRVDAYVSAFSSAGIKLSSIRVGAEALLNYVNAKPELNKASFVLNVIDGPTMLSMIFDNGSNVFMSRSRLYGDTKEQLFQNVLDNMNGLIQFNRSQKFAEITQCYYLGVNEADLRLIEAINPYADIAMKLLDVYSDAGGNLPPEAHFVYLNTLMRPDSINLMSGRRELDKHVKHKKPKKLAVPLLIAYVLILALPIGYFWWMNRDLDKEIETINAFINDEATIEKRNALDALTAETRHYSGIVSQYNEIVDWQNRRNAVTSEMLEFIIMQFSEMVTVTSFDYNELTHTVRLQAKSGTYTDMTYYLDGLARNTGMIEYANNSGYNSDTEGVVFSVEIKLAVKTPAEEEAE
ncbi:MAG: hypothetical protein FWG31_05665 [Oscillospiraceae bacterium]|nr:hypothetical protein [Oscillospiraceae bacterium]